MLPSQLLLFLVGLMPACFGRPSYLPADNSDDTRTKALKKLLQVFGIEDLPQSPYHMKQPPQYMLDLYNTVAGDDGITKDPGILKGNTVRSFLDKSECCDGMGGDCSAGAWNKLSRQRREEKNGRGMPSAEGL